MDRDKSQTKATMNSEDSSRRSGLLLGEDFNVYEDQRKQDEEMSKDALEGVYTKKIFYDLHVIHISIFFLEFKDQWVRAR